MKDLLKVFKSYKSGDKYVGIISKNGNVMYIDFKDWLNKRLLQYENKTVIVTIEISPQQNVKVIESRKEFNQLAYA